MSTAVLERPAPTVAPPPTPSPDPSRRRPRISEAMRVGAACHPQGRIQLYNVTTRATCALGAVAVGLLGPQWTIEDPYLFAKRSVQTLIWEKTGVDLAQLVKAPACCGAHGYHTLGSVIVTLNDGHNWSRERIADYLQSIGF